PGWGKPGGGPVPREIFEGMLEGVAAQGLTFDLVLTGYFASTEQVRLAARACKGATIVVDPIMGDTGKGLYVRPDVAEAIERELIPLADVIAPNAWELERLTGVAVENAASAVEAARRAGKPTLVSSIDCGDQIGVAYAAPEGAWLASHPRLPSAPNGTGDLLTALFAAALLEDLTPAERLRRAVGGVASVVEAANKGSLAELPIVGAALRDGAAVRVEKIA
ncbi:MAG: PfkB family carbohydrate kinase, partial [Ignavibacteriales bacterium]